MKPILTLLAFCSIGGYFLPSVACQFHTDLAALGNPLLLPCSNSLFPNQYYLTSQISSRFNLITQRFSARMASPSNYPLRSLASMFTNGLQIGANQLGTGSYNYGRTIPMTAAELRVFAAGITELANLWDRYSVEASKFCIGTGSTVVPIATPVAVAVPATAAVTQSVFPIVSTSAVDAAGASNGKTLSNANANSSNATLSASQVSSTPTLFNPLFSQSSLFNPLFPLTSPLTPLNLGNPLFPLTSPLTPLSLPTNPLFPLTSSLTSINLSNQYGLANNWLNNLLRPGGLVGTNLATVTDGSTQTAPISGSLPQFATLPQITPLSQLQLPARLNNFLANAGLGRLNQTTFSSITNETTSNGTTTSGETTSTTTNTTTLIKNPNLFNTTLGLATDLLNALTVSPNGMRIPDLSIGTATVFNVDGNETSLDEKA